MEENKNNITRKILYVDASFDNETKEAKISLYDKEDNRLDTLLIKKASNNNEAEKYAILYACIYTKKKNIFSRKVHILNDNYNATQDEQILRICQYFQVGISWIPREINAIADKGTKLDINIKEKESNMLELFYDILINNPFENATKDCKKRDILLHAVNQLTLNNVSQVSIGQVGKYLKDNNPFFEYSSLKKELEKYDDFIIMDNDVKLKKK
ncbi:MAG: hypothetical protein U9N49_04790 [Campylobacterota bacterium]|nr:hypothetical protein [Campylobacterota bacterium]